MKRLGWLLLFLFTMAWGIEPESNVSWEFRHLKDSYLQTDNVWLGIYRNKKEYLRIKARTTQLEESIKKSEGRQKTTPKLVEMRRELGLFKEKLVLSEKIDKRFDEVISLSLEDVEDASIGLFAYLFNTNLKKIEKHAKQLQAIQAEYADAMKYFDTQIQNLETLLQQGSETEKVAFRQFLDEVNADKNYFEIAKELIQEQAHTLNTFRGLIHKKRDAYRSEELPQTLLAFLFLVFLGIALLFSRRIIRKSVQDEDRQFAWSNTVQIVLIVAIVAFGIFFYSENLAYAATLLGLIGAALVVVSKEIVLNFPAWLYIVFSGCVRVGDRVQYMDQFRPHIGDIIGISPFRITLYETINHLTATEIKRAGRILFFPTHYIFTRSIYNFTHEDMKTLLDLIEIDLEFGSDFQEAEKLAIAAAHEITEKYIDLAARQYESLKQKYEMRNFNPKPQVQFLANNDDHCIRMYLWYIAPYREMLNVRSQVTMKILENFAKIPAIKTVEGSDD